MARILVIEDADPLRNDIVEMLTFEGFEVASAENGVIGVDVAREYKPDIIICDIMMPELDGYGVLNALRQDEQMVTVPFIFLTAKTDRTDVRYGMGLGADDYLTKPFVAAELLESIYARLEKRQTFNEMADERIKALSENIITALPHEVRTPLNTIIGFSDMLMTESHRISSNQVVEWARHINGAAQRLYHLVENYLVYVRTEVIANNQEELEALKDNQVKHPGIVIPFHVMLKAQQSSREKDVVVQIEEEAAIRISEHDLGKIVEELVDNALKFSDVGKQVTVVADVEDNHYVITVKNIGRIMTHEQIDSIGAYMQFERRTYEQQGSGLGLTIVKRLVKLYDGESIIENIGDEGVSVIVKLPLA